MKKRTFIFIVFSPYIPLPFQDGLISAITRFHALLFIKSHGNFLKLPNYTVPPQIVPFDFGVDQINVDDMISATCVINKGDLPIEISWWMIDDFGNERKLITNDGIVITRTNPRVSFLTIDSVKARHRGNFSCVANNLGGAAQFSVQLSINGEYIYRRIVLR